MRILIQRVKRASVTVDGSKKSETGQGLLLLVGFEETDTSEDVDKGVDKVTKLRIFDDDKGVMNLSVVDTDGEILVVSQFTLHASTKKGNRPSYVKAARPEKAIPLYEKFISGLNAVTGKETKTGIFGANMQVELVNDGPVTIMIDTKD